MRQYRVGIAGHRGHRFKDPVAVRGQCFATTLLLLDQYLPNNVVFNLNGAPGIAQWFGEACIEYGVDYRIFCPCDPGLYCADWYDDQKQHLQRLLDSCAGLTLVGQELTKESQCAAAQMLVQDSDFIVGFWEGQKAGLTYETIVYAVENSKLVLDGLNDLALITKKNLVKQSGDKTGAGLFIAFDDLRYFFQ